MHVIYISFMLYFKILGGLKYFSMNLLRSQKVKYFFHPCQRRARIKELVDASSCPLSDKTINYKTFIV
jgi:hypothetical protein